MKRNGWLRSTAARLWVNTNDRAPASSPKSLHATFFTGDNDEIDHGAGGVEEEEEGVGVGGRGGKGGALMWRDGVAWNHSYARITARYKQILECPAC